MTEGLVHVCKHCRQTLFINKFILWLLTVCCLLANSPQTSFWFSSPPPPPGSGKRDTVQVMRVFEHVTTIVRNRRGKYSENMDKREFVELSEGLPALRVCAMCHQQFTQTSVMKFMLTVLWQINTVLLLLREVSKYRSIILIS